MKQKALTIILGMIFLIGILGGLSAEEYVGTLKNISGIYINDFVAGDAATANFSFDYVDNFGNKQFPQILRINFSSNDTNYPVWKNDFRLSGFVKKYRLWPFPWYYIITLNCSEENPLIIDHPLGLNTLEVPNGTFYCYNKTSKAVENLNKHDEVYLTVKSNPALWPGRYNLTAEVFYLSDTRPPFVNITNKNAFERYYRENDKVSVEVNVTDDSSISQVYGVANLINGTIDFTSYYIKDGIYYFQEDTPVDISEGDYSLFFFAEDEYNNTGNDSVVLKIDRTPPEIILISPVNASIYDNTIPIKLNVTDNKSGVDNSSVFYRISEIINGTFCPSTGVIFGNFSCYNSGWLPATLNLTSGYYEDVFNATNVTSGSYYFEAKAKDTLGNEGAL